MHQSRSEEHPEAEALRRALEGAGRRFTRQRLLVYLTLHAARRHPTVEEVFLAVRPHLPNISLATVYKALDALVDSGVADRLSSTGGSVRFDARREGHYHIRCTRSGRVEDLPTPFDPDLLAKLDPSLPDYLRESGFELTGYRLELVGHFREPSRPDHGEDGPS